MKRHIRMNCVSFFRVLSIDDVYQASLRSDSIIHLPGMMSVKMASALTYVSYRNRIEEGSTLWFKVEKPIHQSHLAHEYMGMMNYRQKEWKKREGAMYLGKIVNEKSECVRNTVKYQEWNFSMWVSMYLMFGSWNMKVELVLIYFLNHFWNLKLSLIISNAGNWLYQPLAFIPFYFILTFFTQSGYTQEPLCLYTHKLSQVHSFVHFSQVYNFDPMNLFDR